MTRAEGRHRVRCCVALGDVHHFATYTALFLAALSSTKPFMMPTNDCLFWMIVVGLHSYPHDRGLVPIVVGEVAEKGCR